MNGCLGMTMQMTVEIAEVNNRLNNWLFCQITMKISSYKTTAGTMVVLATLATDSVNNLQKYIKEWCNRSTITKLEPRSTSIIYVSARIENGEQCMAFDQVFKLVQGLHNIMLNVSTIYSVNGYYSTDPLNFSDAEFLENITKKTGSCVPLFL